uniref:Translocase of inner mitochondrial membrane 10B n=1 Tax=Ailuropoda melanoleuca TaxID=9646 RepID=A0A7N5JXJ4_AILME
MEPQQQQQQQQLRNEACLHSCAGKLIHSNHRLMAAYVQLMPALVQRRIADYEAASTGPGVAAEPSGTSPSGS